MQEYDSGESLPYHFSTFVYTGQQANLLVRFFVETVVEWIGCRSHVLSCVLYDASSNPLLLGIFHSPSSGLKLPHAVLETMYQSGL